MTYIERGFATIGLILMLVVLGGIAMTGNLLYQQRSSATVLDTAGTQAYQAARSGIDWALYQSLINNSCTNNTISFPNTLNSYTVIITCVRTTIAEGNIPKVTDTITAMACNAPICSNTSSDPLYVERKIQSSVVK